MSVTGETAQAAGRAGPLPPARVPGNRWTAIEVDDVGALEASATVSVVVTGGDPDERLPLTIAALAAQSYPGSLIDVVLDEDASSLETKLREAADSLALRFAARQAGEPSFAATVEAARGEVLVLVPAGAIPSRELVEAHARWHHAVGDAVTIGLSRGVDAGSLRAPDVARSLESGDLEALLDGHLLPGRDDQEQVELYLERTRDLTERRPDLFRLAARGSVGMRADTYRATGGAGQEADQALAALDLAYRLECHGTVFVPERRALTFEHYAYRGPALQGATDDLLENGPADAGTVDPRVADRLPAYGFRSRDSSRIHSRPAMVVNVAAGQEPGDEILETVDAVLRGHFKDLELRLTVEDHPERRLIEEACATDPRVVLGPSSIDGRSEASYQVTLPAVAVPDERTFEDVHELMTKDGMGALHVTVPGELPRNAMVEAVATGPLARARRVAAVDGEDLGVVLGRLFGERWVSGVEVSIRRRGAPEPQVTEHGPLSRATDLEHERKQRLRHSSRAANNQAKADRYAQRAERERIRARAERERARKVESRIARAESGRAYELLRPVGRLAGMVRARVRR